MRAVLLTVIAAVELKPSIASTRGSLRQDGAHVVHPPGSFLARGGREMQPVEQLVPYENRGLAVPAASKVGPISAADWEKELDTVLKAGPTRYVLSKEIDQVEDNLSQDLHAETNQPVSEEAVDLSMLNGGSKGKNLISQIPGSSGDRYFLVGAHYDSIPRSGPAPGAEDTGRGVATLLSIAKLLKAKGPPNRSIHVVLFTAEEEGLLGSEAFVAQAQAQHLDKCDGSIILDEVSFTRNKDHQRLIFETSEQTSAGTRKGTDRIIDSLASSVPTSAPNVTFEVNYHGFGSDHMTLLRSNVPSVLVIERDNLYYASQYGHTARDTKANVDTSFGAKTASLVAQAVWNLANAPSFEAPAAAAQ
jgi:Zn-dependent M28 family amino/carboxypeptidase